MAKKRTDQLAALIDLSILRSRNAIREEVVSVNNAKSFFHEQIETKRETKLTLII